MREESPQNFPLPQEKDAELVCIYIESELKKAGIHQRINIDTPNNTCTVTTDMDVPEEIISNIREYADYKGITIKFLSSG